MEISHCTFVLFPLDRSAQLDWVDGPLRPPDNLVDPMHQHQLVREMKAWMSVPTSLFMFI